MKKENRKHLIIAGCFLASFVLWTVLIRFVDVAVIGPEDSTVGFATINRWFHNMTGVHMVLYHITDWLGLVPLGFVAGFALLGLAQWIQRKQLRQVDRSISLLGGFYVAVMAAYVFFEMIVVNYRPILIDGRLEASYPSSTTMLVMCVMPTAMMQLNCRIQQKARAKCISITITAFIVFMVVGRLISGVHWLTDIVGGGLLSAGLVMLYRFLSCLELESCPPAKPEA